MKTGAVLTVHSGADAGIRPAGTLGPAVQKGEGRMVWNANNTNIFRRSARRTLIRLIEIYSKNWLALDGVWFQSVERKRGMDEAMEHDAEAWRRFTVIEARRIKTFLGLPEHAGLEGLAAALRLRFYANLNTARIGREGDTLVYTMTECRVQTARARKGMPYHPCKPVGLLEYGLFAQTIDDRIRCRCASCYPDVTDTGLLLQMGVYAGRGG